MINWLSSILINLGVYLLAFAPGYVLLGDKKSLKGSPFFVALPIYISVGLTALSLIAYVIGFLIINGLVLLIPSIASIIVILYRMLRNPIPTVSLNKITRANLVVLTLAAFSVIYFAITVAIVSWPPPGDIIAHGSLVSLLRYNGHQSFTLQPLSPYPLYYPTGLHLLAATIAELTGMYSGEAVLVTGGIIISLIPPLLFSLTYLMTRSSTFSFVAYLSAFYIHSQRSMELWLLGYFYNGPYPNLFGFFLAILIIYLVVVTRKCSSRALVCLVLVLLQLFVTYPSFLLTVGVASVFLIRKQLSVFLRKMGKDTLLTILVASTVVALGLAKTLMAITTIVQSEIIPTAYAVDPHFFFDWSAVVVILALVSSYFLIRRRTCNEICIFFLVTFVPAILAINGSVLLPFAGWILPSRVIIISWLLSWVIVLPLISPVLARMPKTRRRYVSFTCLILLIALFQPSVTQNFLLSSPAVGAGSYSHSLSFSYDQNASTWISENVPPNELVLNDMSWSGYYLPSYAYKTVVFQYFAHPPDYNLARQIWLSVTNETLVQWTLKQLGVKWIFLTSDEYFFDYFLYGGDQLYKIKPYSPSFYVTTLDSYAFLQKVYNCGNSTVYKVNL